MGKAGFLPDLEGEGVFFASLVSLRGRVRAGLWVGWGSGSLAEPSINERSMCRLMLSHGRPSGSS
ncbi:MAG: hypothetical protein ACK58T_23785, partial [Phycisphaerae bacterium]